MFEDASKALEARKGSLAEHPLPILLHALFGARRTCGLELKRQALEKVISFEDGIPVGCSSNVATESLGRYLVEKGALDEAQHLKLLSAAAQRGMSFEELLAKSRVLDESTLAKHRQANLARRILDCFRWTDGQFRIVGDAGPGAAEGHKMNALQLVFTGVQSFLPLDVVSKAMGDASSSQRYARVWTPAHPIEELKLSGKDARLLELLDNRPTVAELLASSGLDSDAVLRRLYALGLLGFVDYAEKVPLEAPPAPAALSPPVPITVPLASQGMGQPTSPYGVVTPKAASPSDEELDALEKRIRSGGRRSRTLIVGGALVLGGLAFAGFRYLAPRPEHVTPPSRSSPAVAEMPSVADAPSMDERSVMAAPDGARPRSHRPRGRELSASGILFPLPVAEKKAGAKDVERGARALESGAWEEARRILENAARTAADDAGAQYGAALAHYAAEDDVKARESVALALALNPKHPPSLLLGAYLEQMGGRFSAARERYAGYLAAEPGAPFAEDLKALVAQLPARR